MLYLISSLVNIDNAQKQYNKDAKEFLNQILKESSLSLLQKSGIKDSADSLFIFKHIILLNKTEKCNNKNLLFWEHKSW